MSQTEHSQRLIQRSQIVNGDEFNVGTGFTAKSFHEHAFEGLMDPLIMVDHYTMTEPTFGAHPHAGLSAVSLLFEDSMGRFHNRDSLGNNIDLLPGDLYWLQAGQGVVHDESPRPDAKIHGLQVFVNLPRSLKQNSPISLHVKASEMPIYQGKGFRIRIVLGESQGIQGADSPAQTLTLLDGTLSQSISYKHALKPLENAWLIAIAGSLDIHIKGKHIQLAAGQAVAINPLDDSQETSIHISGASNKDSHFVLFASQPIKESFVQEGPFAMSTIQELEQVKAQYVAGKFGKLS